MAPSRYRIQFGTISVEGMHRGPDLAVYTNCWFEAGQPQEIYGPATIEYPLIGFSEA